MTKSMGTGVVVLLAAILLFIANPTPDSHRATLAESYSQERPLAGAVGLGAVDASFSDYHSLVFASYTTQGDEVRSIGALGMVFVVEN